MAVHKGSVAVKLSSDGKHGKDRKLTFADNKVSWYWTVIDTIGAMLVHMLVLMCCIMQLIIGLCKSPKTAQNPAEAESSGPSIQFLAVLSGGLTWLEFANICLKSLI